MSKIAKMGNQAVEKTRSLLFSVGLLILRLGVGGMMVYGHGWGKVAGFRERAGSFADPIGLGSTTSLILAIFAEVLCAIAVMLGLATRLAAVPLIITMLVAAFVVHADDPFDKTELALMYLTAFLALAFTGAGRYSLDEVWRRRRLKKGQQEQKRHDEELKKQH